MAYREDKLIEAFLDAVWAERGLSQNTLAGYRYDLVRLDQHLQGQGRDLAGAGREDLLQFLAVQVQEGRSKS